MSAYTETMTEAEANAHVHVDRVAALMAEADVLSTRLEEMNVEERKSVPVDMRYRLLKLSEAVIEEPLSDRHKVIRETQPALDHLFDHVYPVLLYWRAVNSGNLDAFNAGQVKDDEP